MRALQVDAFAGGVRGKKHLHLGVVQETRLRLAALLTPHRTVNQHNRLRTAEQRGDLALEIVERITMLRKDDELFAGRWGGFWNWT